MKAVLIYRTRRHITDNSFAEIVVWAVPMSVEGSAHDYKYRLAYIVDGECVLRYDNETGKGDHRHIGDSEILYSFSTLDQLLTDFLDDIAKWRPA